MISKSYIGVLLLLSHECNHVQSFASLRTILSPSNTGKQRASLSMVTPSSFRASTATNHVRKPVAFKHLFRHYEDISMDCWLRCADPTAFLRSCGYTLEEIDGMVQQCPELLNKSVHDHLAPHIRFLVRALGGGTGDLTWASEEEFQLEEDEECLMHDDDVDNDNDDKHRLRVSKLAKNALPVKLFFNLRLEKVLAPWHAYMTWQTGLPSGRNLLQLENGEHLQDFLSICQSEKLDLFVELCNAWEVSGKHHTAEEVKEFTKAFHEGLIPAVRNHLHGQIDCEPGEMVEMLLSHGANHLEDDHHGASLLHWASGSGNMRAVQALLRMGQHDDIPAKDMILTDRVAKDGATVLHWAASGVSPQGVFGNGGHADICRLLLNTAGKDLANQTTEGQNTPLEWAAWAGSLDVVKLLIEEYGADPHFVCGNGNVAHWACAGGSLDVCQYLADVHKVDFCVPNAAKGWVPLNLASKEYHADIAEWLTQRFYQAPYENQKVSKSNRSQPKRVASM